MVIGSLVFKHPACHDKPSAFFTLKLNLLFQLRGMPTSSLWWERFCCRLKPSGRSPFITCDATAILWRIFLKTITTMATRSFQCLFRYSRFPPLYELVAIALFLPQPWTRAFAASAPLRCVLQQFFFIYPMNRQCRGLNASSLWRERVRSVQSGRSPCNNFHDE